MFWDMREVYKTLLFRDAYSSRDDFVSRVRNNNSPVQSTECAINPSI